MSASKETIERLESMAKSLENILEGRNSFLLERIAQQHLQEEKWEQEIAELKERLLASEQEREQLVIEQSNIAAQLDFVSDVAAGDGVYFFHDTATVERLERLHDVFAGGQGGTIPEKPKLRRTWGSLGPAKGQFYHPWGIAASKDGRVAVVDRYNHRICVFDGGEDVPSLVFGGKGALEHQLDSPTGISIDQGRIAVADYGNNCVKVFDRKGQLLFVVDSSSASKLNHPWAVALEEKGDGRIAVADTGNHRVQVFDQKGKVLFRLGGKGSGEGCFSSPSGITFDQDGGLVVADCSNHRIQTFDAFGKFLSVFGMQGSADGQLCKPIGVAVGPCGIIVVADSGNKRVQWFDRSGHFIDKFDLPAGPDNPYGVAINQHGAIFLASYEHHSIQMWQ